MQKLWEKLEMRSRKVLTDVPFDKSPIKALLTSLFAIVFSAPVLAQEGTVEEVVSVSLGYQTSDTSQPS